jgi:hypothetical protein
LDLLNEFVAVDVFFCFATTPAFIVKKYSLFQANKGFANEHLCNEFRPRSTRAVGGLSAVEARWDKIFLQCP